MTLEWQVGSERLRGTTLRLRKMKADSTLEKYNLQHNKI